MKNSSKAKKSTVVGGYPSVVSIMKDEQTLEGELLVEFDNVEPTTENDMISMEEWLKGCSKDELNEIESIIKELKKAKQVVKNIGVGELINNLLIEGHSNIEILKVVEVKYGNTKTTYACVAWYRNNLKKKGII